MSRKLTALKTEVARLRKAIGEDAKGTGDCFEDMAVAVPEPNDRSEEESYACYSFQELKFAFGKDVDKWPLWARNKFGV